MHTQPRPTHQPTAPPGMLTRGAHLTSEDGACLMEAVSVAAHESWTDAPVCTHPLLAHLARLVNDASSDAGRQQLAVLVPDLLQSGPGDPDSAARTSARVAAACTAQALELRPTMFAIHLDWLAAAELRREAAVAASAPRPAGAGAFLGGALAWARRWSFQRGPGARSVEAAVAACLHLPPPQRDVVLRNLLHTGLDAARTSAPSRSESRAQMHVDSSPCVEAAQARTAAGEPRRHRRCRAASISAGTRGRVPVEHLTPPPVPNPGPACRTT